MATRRLPNSLTSAAPLTDASNKGLARLTLFASHFHQVYDFAIARNLYPEAQKLAATICNTVEYHLENDDQYQHLDAPARRLARLWGLVYIYNEGDTIARKTTLATLGTTPPVTPA